MRAFLIAAIFVCSVTAQSNNNNNNNNNNTIANSTLTTTSTILNTIINNAGGTDQDEEDPENLLEYTRRNNKHLEARHFFEGDIRRGDIPLNDGGGTGIRHKGDLWRKKKGKVIVPYVIDEKVMYNKFHKDNIKYAMEMIQYKTGCIKFRKRTTEKDFILFTMRESGCWSYVGRIGGRQVVNLDHNCADEHGVAIHEIIHALGFWHMHSHSQRDNFVRINYQNIAHSDRHNFDKISAEEASSYGTIYDYLSIMHYGPYYFSAVRLDFF
jgi:hypothetical protein